MPEITVDVELECVICGRELSATVGRNGAILRVSVDPCDWCLNEAEQEGYKRGRYEEGEEA